MKFYRKHDEIKKALPWLVFGFILAIICISIAINNGGANITTKIFAIISLVLMGKGMSYDPTNIFLSETTEDWEKRNKEKWGQNWPKLNK